MQDRRRRWIYFFAQGQADAGRERKHLIGGKGASLGELTRAQFNVPPGFTISAECCDFFHNNSETWPDDLQDEVRDNVQRLQSVTGRSFGAQANPLRLAVRSGAAESMPGMMDTLLNVSSWDALLEAITAVFRSWNSERAVAYRTHHLLSGLLGTAVTVQAMCPAEVAGVLFTEDPLGGSGRIVIEAARGLGEAVVSGKVTPDRFVVDRNELSILERVVANSRDMATLNDERIGELSRLGLRVESHFNYPCDIEWSFAEGQFWLLQARAIRFSSDPEEREGVRRKEIEALGAKAVPEGTVWARFNLSEVLPEPTPMTWTIVQRFLAGSGGYGLMYRDLGFDPDPGLADEGVFDLVCGRPYCNLSREPRMQYRHLPFEHPFAALKAKPERALYPQPILNPARAGWRFWLFLPFIFYKVWRASVKVRRINKTFAAEFLGRIVPAFLKEVEVAQDEATDKLSAGELRERLSYWTQRTLVDFARHSLKPTALAGMALGNLERVLAQRYKDVAKGQAAVRELVIGIKPPADADLAAALRELRAGRLSKADFLRRFGHRGNQEMELARPRWSEEPDKLKAPAPQSTSEETPDYEALRTQTWQRLSEELKLLPHQRRVLEAELQTVHTYLALREAGKHYLLRGYALIRRYLVELDRRLDLQGGIFFLTPAELSLEKNQMASLIAQQRRRRQIALGLFVPQVLFSDDLDAIGRDLPVTGIDAMQGVPLSSGMAQGMALVLEEPDGALPPDEPYILVCPSTDPAWSPLFATASGLVMETGGVLSHGAIVAREYGLPAVAGIPNVHRRIKTGQRLQVDGTSGKVVVLA